MDVAFLSIDNLVGEALSNGLERLDGVLSSSLGDQVDGLVDSSQGRHVHGLLSHHTSGSDSGGVFSGTSLQDCTDEHFKRVSASQQVDDFESVSDDADGLDLLTSVSAVELHGANESFDNGAECFSELFGLVSSCGVRDEDLRLDGLGSDVVDEAWILDLSVGGGTLMSS